MKPKQRYRDEQNHRIYTVEYGNRCNVQIDLDNRVFPYRVKVGDFSVPFLTRDNAEKFFQKVENDYRKSMRNPL